MKRPGGTFSFDVQPLATDAYGEWLSAPTGSGWEAPHDTGTLSFDVVALVHPEHWWVTWWVDDPADRRVEIDVCLPPERTADGWRFVDLELDPMRHHTGAVEVYDHDEFEVACRNGSISASEAETALATATTMAERLRTHAEPWGREGRRRLDAARDTRASRLRS